jgi:RNA polymerase sigma-70 factor (ECF subfamily)
VEEHNERAVRLAWRLVGGDRAAAEDVAQDAFLAAHRGLSSFRGDAALSTWFYRILVRRAANYRRWRGLRDLWAGEWREELADPRPEAHSDPALRRRIGDALGRLTRRQREAFVLVHLDGLSMREAAAIMQMADGTVKSHLHRARASLREELGDLREEAPRPDETGEPS